MKTENVKEESEETPEQQTENFQKVTLTNLSGEVIKAKRFGIYVSFSHDSRSQIGMLFPGRSYVNAANLLLDVCKTDSELGLLLPKGSKVSLDVVSQPTKNVPEEHEGNRRALDSTKRCGWHITTMWVGQQRPLLGPDAKFDAEIESFKGRLETVSKQVACLTLANPAALSDTDKWFVTALQVPGARAVMPHPDEAPMEQIDIKATVTEVHKPNGAVVELEEGRQKVFVHRSRLYLDGDHLSATLDLGQFLKVGQSLTVDYIESKDLFEGHDHVALLAYTGEDRPHVPKAGFKDMTCGGGERHLSKFFIARIVSFDEPGETGVESGLAEIVQPTVTTTLAFVKSSFTKFVDLDPSVKLVKFHRSQMFHLGSPLAKADLRYFFSTSSFSMNVFFCHVAKLEGDKVASHEVTLGWKSSTSFLHATGQGSLALTASTTEDTLLFPRIYSFAATKCLAKEGWDVETYENIIEGQLPPRSEYWDCDEAADGSSSSYAFARVYDLYPVTGSNGVSYCIVHVETGEHAGEKAFVDRNNSSAFGWKLNKADLQHVLEHNDPVFVKLVKSDKKEHHVKLRAAEMWIGWPTMPKDSKDAMKQMPEDVPQDKRYKFLLYLESHGMSLGEFMKTISGERPPRQFLPFRKDENKGTIVQLDRAAILKKCNRRTTDQQRLPPLGSCSGIIKVDRGPLAGQLVAFHRRNTWVLGYNMSKADLTHIFIEGQKVSLEAISCAGEDKRFGQANKREHEYTHRATLVWTSKFRPRNDIDKTVPESVHVNNWLRKRNLTWEKFQMLAKGTLPMVDPQLATRHKSNMLKGNEIANIDTTMKQQQDSATTVRDSAAPSGSSLESLPVFRHGSDAARICDVALSVNGPNDRRIKDIIRNDDNAQMAFHMHKALGMALDVYKKSAGRVRVAGEAVNGTNMMNEGVFINANNPPAFGGGGGGGGQQNDGWRNKVQAGIKRPAPTPPQHYAQQKGNKRGRMMNRQGNRNRNRR